MDTPVYTPKARIMLALLPLLALSCSQSNEPFWTRKKAVYVNSGETTPAPEDPRFTTSTAPDDPRFTDNKPEVATPPESKPIENSVTNVTRTPPAKPNIQYVDVGSKIKDGPANVTKNAPPKHDPALVEPTDPLLKDASEISPENGRFIIWVPDQYTTIEDVDEKRQKLDGNMEITICKASGENGTCMAAFNDFPATYVKTQGEEALRNEIIDGFIGSLSGKITRKDKIKVAGRDATSIRFTGKNQMCGRLIVLIDGNRAYQLAFLSTLNTEPEKPAVEAFFKSFKLLKN